MYMIAALKTEMIVITTISPSTLSLAGKWSKERLVMDINYHYFAVKAIACKSGFAKDEAQMIATYSQFVDDFDLYIYIWLDEVPEYARYLAKKVIRGYFFNPVTTGFDGLKQVLLVKEKNQNWILTPYHFIPERRIKQLLNRCDWCVTPARMDTPSLITEMLKKAKETLITDKQSDRKVHLMRIGMLLHTFADTYAHQNFSGYWGWENHSYIEKVIDNIDNKDITSSYNPGRYKELPSIGHTNVSHAPDDSNVTFDIREKLYEEDKKYSLYYSRSNTVEYLTASREIMNFLRSCLKLPPIEEREWNEFSKLLSKGFLTAQKDVTRLKEHWESIFPTMSFHYKKDEVLQSMLTLHDENSDGDFLEALYDQDASSTLFSAKSDLFFQYNVLADEIRTTVHDEKFSPVWLES
jgi:hypothetical protein